MRQLTLATAGFERCGKTTRRAVFLGEMEHVVPWRALCARHVACKNYDLPWSQRRTCGPL
jgi:hypothetical protein